MLVNMACLSILDVWHGAVALTLEYLSVFVHAKYQPVTSLLQNEYNDSLPYGMLILT